MNQVTSTFNQKSSENGLGQHQEVLVILKKSKWLEKVKNLSVQHGLIFPTRIDGWIFLPKDIPKFCTWSLHDLSIFSVFLVQKCNIQFTNDRSIRGSCFVS